MHIPDGFVAPHFYVPAYGVVVSFALYSFNKFKEKAGEKTLPYVASLAAFAFVLSSIAVPIPGGTSVHGIGVAPIAILFGPAVSFITYSIVLLIQALIFREGGITTFPINSIAMGIVGSYSACILFKLLGKGKFSIFISGFVSVLLSASVIALILGLQPVLFKDPQGKPLYFPFGFNVVFPAILIPHIVVGIAEGVLTVILYKILSGRLRYEG